MPFSEYASILPVRVEVPLRSAPSIWARRSRLRSSTRIESEKDISCLQFSDDLLIFHVRISYWWRILGRHLRVVIRDRDDVAFEKKNNKKLENWPLMTTWYLLVVFDVYLRCFSLYEAHMHVFFLLLFCIHLKMICFLYEARMCFFVFFWNKMGRKGRRVCEQSGVLADRRRKYTRREDGMRGEGAIDQSENCGLEMCSSSSVYLFFKTSMYSGREL